MLYYYFILLIGAERLVELAVSRRNARWSFEHGGREFGRGHYPAMVSMHVVFLVSRIVEVACGHAGQALGSAPHRDPGCAAGRG